MEPNPTISERLADHVVGLHYDDIPDAVIEKAKFHLAHHFGTAFLGCERENGRQAVRVARELSGSDGRCSVIGSRHRAEPLDAVFANAFLMHCVGMDDFLLPQGINLGVVTQPVAWAIGEARQASGRDLLAAVIVGYDVAGRLCDPSFTWGRDTYSPAKALFEPFGAAATAARLLGLSRERMVHALGHAAQVGWNMVGTGSNAWTMHPLLARNGGMAAVLARAGVPARSAVVEGQQGLFGTFFGHDTTDFVDAGLQTLGTEFVIAQAQTKWQEGSGLNVIAVDLTQHLLAEHELDVDHLTSIDVVIPVERQARETKREARLVAPESDRTSRLASLRFRIALMLTDGRIDMTRFERQPDPDVLAALELVELRYEEGRPILYARVEMTTTTGERHTSEGDTLTAPPVDSTTWLGNCGRTVLSEAQLTRLADLVNHLEDVPDVGEVMACVVPTAAS